MASLYGSTVRECSENFDNLRIDISGLKKVMSTVIEEFAGSDTYLEEDYNEINKKITGLWEKHGWLKTFLTKVLINEPGKIFNLSGWHHPQRIRELLYDVFKYQKNNVPPTLKSVGL